MTDEVTIQQFLQDEVRILRAFQAYWAQEHLANPEHFPATMGMGEWWEQLRSFSDTMTPEIWEKFGSASDGDAPARILAAEGDEPLAGPGGLF